MFNENTEEFSAKQGKKIPVWRSSKYEESRAKAIDIINGKKHGLNEADFWILMNETKSGKMGYTGLIISHNGCLKINDCLEDPFRPECVSINKDGWGGSLVFSYCCAEQGIFEVGEVSSKNCKNDYPYAMALKRLFDRVVLKLSKLAYSGIYSETESDEFRDPQKGEAKEERPSKAEQKHNDRREAASSTKYVCEDCGKDIVTYTDPQGGTVSPYSIAVNSKKKLGRCLCVDCAQRTAYRLAREERSIG